MDRIVREHGFRVVVEPLLDWQAWRLENPPTLIVGRERWATWQWALTRHTVLETDPGPLDARVP